MDQAARSREMQKHRVVKSIHGVRGWFGMVLVAVAASACRGELPTPTDRTLEGRYTLRTIDGSALPYSRTVKGGVETIQSGFIEFGVEGESGFKAELNYTFQQGELLTNGVVRRQGIWLEYDDQILLTYVGHAPSEIARVKRSEISVRSEGISSPRTQVVVRNDVTLACGGGCAWTLVFAK